MAEEVMTLDMASSEAPPERTSAFEYDLVVLGGGSGGLSCGKNAAGLGAKVAILDYVVPTPIGTTWGLGGTCVNVGCIPKKMMHLSATLGEYYEDHQASGWQLGPKTHSWNDMVDTVQRHIKKLNWGYKVDLLTKAVDYINMLGRFKDAHTIECFKEGNEVQRTITAEHIVIATGGRPNYGDVPGASECCITSDDIFSMKDIPDHVLIVGASYIALECAGFLHGLGKQVTVMVRSIFLRGFDQQMANLIGDHMDKTGVEFLLQTIPTNYEKVEAGVAVTYSSSGDVTTRTFPLVLAAIGRHGLADTINLSAVGIESTPNGKIVVNEANGTTVPNIHAIGDIQEGRLELTPTAILAGRHLAHRLFEAGATKLMDYTNVPTTVFTPLEYSCCGYSEEAAIETFGEGNIEVYHSFYPPLEWQY